MRANEFIQKQQNINEGVHDPAIFKVVFVIGGPGSGKSTISDMLGLRSLGFVPINSDEALTYLMSKEKLSLKMPPEETEKREKVRSRAKEITAEKMQNAIDGRLGIIIDGTGEDLVKIESLNNNFKQLGYETALIQVLASLETAKARNAARPRSVPEDILEKKWYGVQRNMPKFDALFPNAIKIDNNGSIADVKPQVDSAYKKIAAWAKKRPTNPQATQWIASQMPQQNENTILGHEPTRNPKYLGGQDKVANISPVLGAKPKKQVALMKKFFGGS